MGSRQPIRIAVVAGEPSGDSLGAGLIEAIREVYPEARFEGIGGPKMQEAGCEVIYQMDRIGVMGLDGLIGKLFDILSIRKSLLRQFSSEPPHLFIGIDVPDFNLTLEKNLKDKGIPCVHYVSPTVWAWRGYRIHKIRRSISHMLTLFPFEASYYQQKGVPVTCVGHPMADEIDEPNKLRARRSLNLDSQMLTVALLPGSRRSEVKKLGKLFVETAEQLVKSRSEIQFVLPFANCRVRDEFYSVVDEFNHLPIRVLEGNSRLAMEASDIVVLASGTAALEAALLCRPHVVVYKLSAFSYWLMRKLRHVDYYSMPNHLLPEPMIPELIQEDANAENVVAAVERYLSIPEEVKKLERCFKEMHQQLKLNANLRARDAVLELIKFDDVI